jgi:hypothetical protein
LLAEQQILDDKAGLRAENRQERSHEGLENRHHQRNLRSVARRRHRTIGTQLAVRCPSGPPRQFAPNRVANAFVATTAQRARTLPPRVALLSFHPRAA